MRLFAAVLPPDPVVTELGRAVDRLADHDGLRWTGRPGWHVTLAFYGDVPDETLPELTERLARAAARTEPFELGLRGGGQFGERALWAGVRGDVAVLRRLAERAEAAAAKAGLPMEQRHYRPHLTLARSRDGDAGLGPYVEALDAFESTAWTVGELTLMRSHLPTSGVPRERSRYEKVGGWKLSRTR